MWEEEAEPSDSHHCAAETQVSCRAVRNHQDLCVSLLSQSCAVTDVAGGISTVLCRIIILAFSASPPSFVCASKLGFFCVCVCLEAVCLPRSRTKLLARLCGFYDAAATGMTSPPGKRPSAEQCDVFACVRERSVQGSRIDSIQIFYGITRHSCFRGELAERKSLT